MNFYYLLVVSGIFAASCSQVLLKISADRPHCSRITCILNPHVLLAYSILFGSLLVNTYAFSKGVMLKDLPALESLAAIFVPILSFLILREHVTARKIAAALLIATGLYIFYL